MARKAIVLARRVERPDPFLPLLALVAALLASLMLVLG